MRLIQRSYPEQEFVSLAEAKKHLRVTSTEQDGVIETLIAAARQRLEAETGRAFVDQRWELRLDNFPLGIGFDARTRARLEARTRQHVIEMYDIVIPKPPCIMVTDVTYYGADDQVASLEQDVDYYFIEAGLQRARLRPKTSGSSSNWPDTSEEVPDPVRITFRAGFPLGEGSPGDPTENVPKQIKQASLLLIGHYYENREEVITTSNRQQVFQLPDGVAALISPFIDRTPF